MSKTKEKEVQTESQDPTKAEVLDLIGEPEPESVQTPTEKKEKEVAAGDVEEKAGEEGKVEEPKKVEEVAKEEVVEKEEPEEKPKEPTGVEETDLSKAQKEVALYKAELEELAGKIIQQFPTPPVKDVPKGEDPAAEVTPPEPAGPAEPAAPAEIVDEETYEKLLQDRGAFNKFMAGVVANVNKTARADAVTDMLRILPTYNAQQRSRERLLEGHINDFWKKHEDLKAMPRFVGVTCTEVESQHPDWDIEKVLEETAKVVRTKLALHEKVKEEASPEGVKPVGMPSLTSTRKPPAKAKTGQAKELEDLLEGVEPGGLM